MDARVQLTLARAPLRPAPLRPAGKFCFALTAVLGLAAVFVGVATASPAPDHRRERTDATDRETRSTRPVTALFGMAPEREGGQEPPVSPPRNAEARTTDEGSRRRVSSGTPLVASLAQPTPLPAPTTETAATVQQPAAPLIAGSARRPALGPPPWPWVRTVLASVCVVFAAGIDDTSGRVGWLMLGGGLAGWAAWDVTHPTRQTLSQRPLSQRPGTKLAWVHVSF